MILRRPPDLDLEMVDAGDAEFRRRLATYWAELGISPSQRWTERYLERVFAEQGQERHTFWVYRAGQRVGFAMVRLETDWLIPERRLGYICEFYIFPAERRHGLGRVLAQGLIAFLRARGATTVELDVLPGNTGGQAFWRAVGFTLSHHHMRLSQ